MLECPRCGVKIPEEGITSIEPIICTTCGYTLPPTMKERGKGLIRNYFKDLWQILANPQSFFRHLPHQGGMSKPLGFALVTHWIGSAMSFLWQLLFGGSFLAIVQSWFGADLSQIDYPGHIVELSQMKHRFFEWFTGVGPVIADPFFTLASILLSSFLIFIAARIFVPAHSRISVTYETAVRISCYGLTPAILSALPILGGIVSSVYILVVTVIGTKEVYKISTGRALVIALFPKLIIPGIIGTGLLLFIIALIKWLFATF